MLDQDELKRRLVAARLLHGLSQKEVGVRFKEIGLPQEDPGRIERGAKAMQHVHRQAFAEILEVPPEWFTVPSEELLKAIRYGLVEREGAEQRFNERLLKEMRALIKAHKAAELAEALNAVDAAERAAAEADEGEGQRGTTGTQAESG